MKRYINSGKWVRSGYDSFIKDGDDFYWTSEEDIQKARLEASKYISDIDTRPFCDARYPDSALTILNHRYGWTDESIARSLFFIYDIPANREYWGINNENIIDIRTE